MYRSELYILMYMCSGQNAFETVAGNNFTKTLHFWIEFTLGRVWIMSDNNQLNWLYPDLMCRNDLISVLKQRYIQTESLDLLDKNELVELYTKYIIPLPQRKYRVNRRGQKMTQKQIIASKKRRLESPTDIGDKSKVKRKSSGNLLTSFELPSKASSGTGDRLKPPPYCVNLDKKKIKLNSSVNSSPDSVSSKLNKIKIYKAHSNDIGMDSSQPKKIKLSSSGTSCEDVDVPCSVDCTVPEQEQSHQEGHTIHSDISAINDVVAKKKISKISWP